MIKPLTPQEYNDAYESIGNLKILVRALLDSNRCKNCYAVEEAYSQAIANIYRRWYDLNDYLIRDDSLASQFFAIFRVLTYAHERSKKIHRARALETALPQDQPVSEVVASIQRLTEALEDLPADHLPADLEPLKRDYQNVKGLKELAASADTAIDLYLDAKVAADFRAYKANQSPSD